MYLKQKDDTSSESSDSDDSSNDSTIYVVVIWSDVCNGRRNQTSKLGMRESMGGHFFQGGGGGVSLNIIIMWGGGLKLIFAQWEGGNDLVLGPLQVIIAQSLITIISNEPWNTTNHDLLNPLR